MDLFAGQGTLFGAEREAAENEHGAATPAQRSRPGTRANDLDGKTWERYSISVWSDIRKTAEELKLGHPAMFPVELVRRLILCFTTREDRLVLDPFAGTGSTVLAAASLGKKGIGIEISEKYCRMANSRPLLSTLDLGEGQDSQSSAIGERLIYNDDARNLLKYVAPNSVDLVVTSPPYWDILLQDRTADNKPVRHYGDAEGDLGKIHDYREFLAALQGVFRLVFEALKPGKYCIVVVMDIRKKDSFYPYHSDVAALMQEIGFVFDDIIIWDRRHEYNNMRPLGYPYRFRVNKAHEYILIFLKPREAG